MVTVVIPETVETVVVDDCAWKPITMKPIHKRIEIKLDATLIVSKEYFEYSFSLISSIINDEGKNHYI